MGSKKQLWINRRYKNNKGETNYLHSLANNLFEQLTPQNLTYYNSGDGHETRDSKTRLAKMKAIHSSSAIVVNLFQYWQGKNIYPIMRACNLCAKDSSYLVQENPINPYPKHLLTTKSNLRNNSKLVKTRIYSHTHPILTLL